MTQRLAWEKTHPNDFSATDPETGEPVGRIYLATGVPDHAPKWLWFANGRIGDRNLSQKGAADTKQDAADALTDHWLRVKADVQAAKRNAYLKARGE